LSGTKVQVRASCVARRFALGFEPGEEPTMKRKPRPKIQPVVTSWCENTQFSEGLWLQSEEL